MSNFNTLISELIPLYFRGDFPAIINKLSEPQNISFLISFISEKIDFDRPNKLYELEKEKVEMFKKIAASLENIDNVLSYAPEGKGYLEAQKDYEQKTKKRKVRLEEDGE